MLPLIFSLCGKRTLRVELRQGEKKHLRPRKIKSTKGKMIVKNLGQFEYEF
jgi:hypothetical protein